MRLLHRWVLLLGVAWVAVGLVPAHAENVEKIVAMARDGASEKALLKFVERSEDGFALSEVDQIVACKQAGVPDRVILAMLRNPVSAHASQGWLDQELYRGVGLRITWWKFFAYLGTLIFAGRWFVQMYASRKAGRPVTTVWFWVMSLVGSVFCLWYWIFGPKHDSVGVLQNLFPMFVAVYNLYLEVRYYRANGVPAYRHGETKAPALSVSERAAPAPLEVAVGK